MNEDLEELKDAVKKLDQRLTRLESLGAGTASEEIAGVSVAFKRKIAELEKRMEQLAAQIKSLANQTP